MSATWRLSATAIVVKSLAVLVATSVAAQPALQQHVTEQHVRDLGYVRFDIPLNYRLRIHVGEAFGAANMASKVQCGGFAMTGAYIKLNQDIPDGLLIADGKRYGSDNGRTDGGFLTISGAAVSLQRARSFRQTANASPTQVYSQPILVIDGHVDWGLNRPERTNRVALGKYRDGGLFMVMAFNTDRNGMSAVTLGQFAADVLENSTRPIDWLLNFDGGPSAFLYNHSGRSYGPANGRVISYFCAEPVND